VETLNKLYVCNIKEILSEPTRRFPYTSVNSLNTYHLQHGRINPEYSIVLYKTYPSEKIKDSKDMHGYRACGFIASAGSITRCASL
jgi:hypothetical protein